MQIPSRTKIINRERLIRLFAVIGLISLFFLVLLKVDNMLMAFLLAFVITYLMNPFVNLIERRGVKRRYAIAVPFLCGGILIAFFVSVIAPMIGEQFSALQKDMPKYVSGLTELLNSTEEKINSYFQDYFNLNLSQQFIDISQNSVTSLINSVPSFASSFVTTLLLAPFFAYFLLLDGRNINGQLLKLVPNNLFELFLNLSYQTNKQMGDFIRARLAEAAIVGLVIWIGLSFANFPYAPLLALFAAITNLIPYIGPFIGAIPAFAIAFINKDTSFTLLMITLTYSIAQIIDIFFIIPLVVAKLVDLHPVTVIIVIVVGAQLMGILGMIISIPVASILKLTTFSVYRHLVNFRI